MGKAPALNVPLPLLVRSVSQGDTKPAIVIDDKSKSKPNVLFPFWEFPDLPERPDAKTVFVKLRELRNKW